MTQRLFHGMTRSREYKSWRSMKDRCLNPNNPDYEHYGGKGITVCQEWIHDFPQFLKDMGPRPKNHSLDRIDCSKGYCKENCRWATELTQKRNRLNVLPITWNGETKTIREWALQFGMSDITLRKRLKKWSIERALTEPVDIKKKSR